MILGIGVDIARNSRFALWLEDRQKLERFFHSEEIAYCLEQGPGSAASLAARFAAREAFAKALGRGFRDFPLKDVWVSRDGQGRPNLNTAGKAREAANARGVKAIHLSLSHERDYAVAMVVIE